MASNPPFGGSLDQQAQWANQNINSNFGVDAWKAMGPMDSGCPPNLPYRSQRAGGDNACVEHPDNCPEGKTLHGSTCIPWDQANAMFGGGYGPGSAPAAPQVAPNPLAGMMAGLPQAGMPQIPGGVGGFREIPGQSTPRSTQDLSQMLVPYQNTAQAPVSGTQSLIKALPSAQMASQPAQGLGTGWSTGQDGLTQMMAKQQRKQALPGGAPAGWWA
jgi:hypothetical protein